jgi:hypothetical protein
VDEEGAGSTVLAMLERECSDGRWRARQAAG